MYKKTFLMAFLLSVVLTQNAGRKMTNAELKEEGMRRIPLSRRTKIKYIRRLMKFLVKKFYWREKFNEKKCPPFQKVHWDKIHVCKLKKGVVVPVLPPIKRCEVNISLAGCQKPEDKKKGNKVIKPNYKKYPDLMKLPTKCDLPRNRLKKQCQRKKL